MSEAYSIENELRNAMKDSIQRDTLWAAVFWICLTAAALISLARWLHPAMFSANITLGLLIVGLAAAVVWLKDTYV